MGTTRALIVRTYVEDSGGSTRALRGGVYGDEKTYMRSLDITAVCLLSDDKEVRKCGLALPPPRMHVLSAPFSPPHTPCYPIATTVPLASPSAGIPCADHQPCDGSARVAHRGVRKVRPDPSRAPRSSPQTHRKRHLTTTRLSVRIIPPPPLDVRRKKVVVVMKDGDVPLLEKVFLVSPRAGAGKVGALTGSPWSLGPHGSPSQVPIDAPGNAVSSPVDPHIQARQPLLMAGPRRCPLTRLPRS